MKTRLELIKEATAKYLRQQAAHTKRGVAASKKLTAIQSSQQKIPIALSQHGIFLPVDTRSLEGEIRVAKHEARIAGLKAKKRGS